MHQKHFIYYSFSRFLGADHGQDLTRGHVKNVIHEARQEAADRVAIGREVETIPKFLIRLLIGQISVMTRSRDLIQAM